MTAQLDDDVDAVFQALADRTRRDIVARVLVEGLSVSELAAKYDMSFAAVQKHVAVLERAGLVTKQRSGRRQVTRTDLGAIRTVRDLLGDLEVQWRERVERIDALLAAEGDGSADGDAPDTTTTRPGSSQERSRRSPR
ncbi:ArsR/SmtB family transcription factor [Brevibacterium casei]|uniref:ArsR/SmtB family transcription factor n=1 Tax=Brevibacterium casei TaxID=33889 RepID=UPI0021AEAE2E|nr:metalloregulator ArsR/SmtB family transcription factor [Brevibacterium casei]MCT1550168.1 metalloregulator ArsR/SmtB family transcription factor [Brevibacterium casei]MCT1560124.1 metalloregulator ArsR/SmtB family transcription factor [Brevibacterium casei]MCT2208278.1 metalloregulator ArsR/SmtB family transcription factor [Brevibacterium casei]